MDKPLYQLAYISSAVYALPQHELEALLHQAREHNHTLGITGMLLYAEGAFLQVLEGPQQAVENLYAKIHQDPRHCRATVIHQATTAARLFPDWKMGFRYLDRQAFTRLPGFTDLLRDDSPAAEALRQKPQACYQMLISFSRCSAVVPLLEEI